VLVFFFFGLKAELQVLKVEFHRLSWGRTAAKLNWQNFAKLGLQLKFTFRMWLKEVHIK